MMPIILTTARFFLKYLRFFICSIKNMNLDNFFSEKNLSLSLVSNSNILLDICISFFKVKISSWNFKFEFWNLEFELWLNPCILIKRRKFIFLNKKKYLTLTLQIKYFNNNSSLKFNCYENTN